MHFSSNLKYITYFKLVLAFWNIYLSQIPTNHAGLIEYRAHPFWIQKYCPSHEHDGTPRCCSCERMEVSMNELVVNSKAVSLSFPRKILRIWFSDKKIGSVIFLLFTCSHETQGMLLLMMGESSAWSAWTLQSWIPMNANPFILIYKNFMNV